MFHLTLKALILQGLLLLCTANDYVVNSLVASSSSSSSSIVRPVWFSSKDFVDGQGSKIPKNADALVVFIHGRLEAKNGQDPFACPEELYCGFCYGLCQSNL